MNANNGNNNPASPMHLGMAGPPGSNPFTVDEIQELMGLIPSDQQQQAAVPTGGSHHQQQLHHGGGVDESIHGPMHVNAVGVPTAASSGLASVLIGNLRGPPGAAPPLVGCPGAKGLGAATEIDDGSKNQARSERKRSREKQRRTDVNKQFGELTEVLKRIEAEEQQLQQERVTREEARNPNGKSNGGVQASRMILPPFSPTNRVDLIARTIAHLERLSHVTKKQVQELQGLEEQLKTSKKAGEDMAQKLKEAVFNQQQQGGMMMNGVNPMCNPMQMAMGGMSPMSMVGAAPGATAGGMLSIQPQKQQMMMMVPMMMPPGGGAPGAAPMMPAGNQPFMMMPQAFLPSQQQSQQPAPAPGPSSSVNGANAPASSTTAAPTTGGSGGPAPAVSQQQQIQNQQSMMMQQAVMMQSMQPMMQQMQQQPQQAPVPAQYQQRMQQQQMVFPAPQQQQQQARQPAPIMPAPTTTAGMAASQQRQQQPQRTSPVGSVSPGNNGSVVGPPSSQGCPPTTKAETAAAGHQQQPGGGSYAYAA